MHSSNRDRRHHHHYSGCYICDKNNLQMAVDDAAGSEIMAVSALRSLACPIGPTFAVSGHCP